MAIIIRFGAREFGRVEDALGGYVATRFFHVYYLPLIPIAGVRGTVDASGALREERGPLSGASIALAYFQWFGALAVAGLAAFAFNAIERPPDTLGFALAFASFALFSALVASWVWIGRRAVSSRSKLAVPLVPAAILGAVFAFAFAERAHRSDLPSHHYANAQQDWIRAHPGSDARDFALDRLRAIAASQRAIASPAVERCDSTRIHTGRYEGRDLIGVDGEFLDRWLAADRAEVTPKRPWLVSPTLLALVNNTDPRWPISEFAEHPYIAVYRISDEKRGAQGWIHVYDVLAGARLCSARLQTTHLADDEFFEDASKAVASITRAVYVDNIRGKTK